MDRNLIKKTVHYCGVTELQQTGLYFGKLLVQGAVNTMGTAAIAAYTATIRIEGFANSFGDSGCSAILFLAAEPLSRLVMRTVLSWIFIGRFGLGTVAAATGIGWLYVNLFWGYHLKPIQIRQQVREVNS